MTAPSLPRTKLYMSLSASTPWLDFLDVDLNGDDEEINVHTSLGLLALPIDFARRLVDGLTKALAEYDNTPTPCPHEKWRQITHDSIECNDCGQIELDRAER